MIRLQHPQLSAIQVHHLQVVHFLASSKGLAIAYVQEHELDIAGLTWNVVSGSNPAAAAHRKQAKLAIDPG